MAIKQPSTLAAKDTEKVGEPGELDVILLLVRDHRAVQQTLNDFQRSKERSDRQRLLEHVLSELKKHEQAEEQVFWPVIRRELPGGDKLAADREAEERHAKQAIAELEGMRPDATGWDAKVQSFIGDVLTHASHEEREVFVPAREGFAVDRLMELGREFQQAKKGD